MSHWDYLLWVCLYLLYLSLPCVRLHAFYVWYHVMLHSKAKTFMTGSLYLHCLFYDLSMIMISVYICTRVHLYIIIIDTDGPIMNMCLCLLFVWYIIGLAYFTTHMHLYEYCANYGCICLTVHVLIISPQARLYISGNELRNIDLPCIQIQATEHRRVV